ncbi:MAG TPA: cbb3-type cytochrome c oxidase N-terminal domain-containing protein [Methylomirabilota bacterium]|nr:cbb3-type cytochrome c oxidase N-terminal domain-containing protein [Methylomirabilota bacterium]
MNNPKDPNEQDPLLIDHEADGIKELDNLLPRWWVWLFYLCIAFSVGYMLYYHVLNVGDLQIAEYQKEAKAGEAIKSAALAKFESSLDSLEPLKDDSAIAAGNQAYLTYCAPCHRADGGGLVGPNLTDDYWIHGSNYVESVKVIINGVPDKGMLTWRGVLKPAEIQNVASYIWTLRGTKPENPKPPENQQAAAPASNDYE